MPDTSMIVYPSDHVFGSIDDLASVEAVLAEMTERDVPEGDIIVLTVEEGSARSTRPARAMDYSRECGGHPNS